MTHTTQAQTMSDHRWNKIQNCVLTGAVCATLVLGFISYRQSVHLEQQSTITNAFQKIIETSDTAFALVDSNGRIQAWSKGAERLFDVSRNDAIGYGVSFMMPATYRGKHRDAFEKCVKKIREGDPGDPVRFVECEGIGEKGCPMDIMVTVRTVPGTDGNPLFLASIDKKFLAEEAAEPAADGEHQRTANVER